jgi:ABC-2 type transport system permease protein
MSYWTARWIELYRAFLRTALLEQIQYRASGAIWMIGSILEPVVFLAVWSTVAKAQGGSVEGYGARDFAAYYVILLIVNHLTFSWTMHDFQFRIQFGTLSFDLLRPVHPIHGDIAANLAYKVVMLIVMLPALVILTVAFSPNFTPVAWSLVAFAPAVFLAFLLRFLFEWTLALAAFWTTRVTAINQIYFSLLMFLAGRVAPIALLPPWLRDVAHDLPFYYMVGFPVELALGRLTPTAALVGFATQLLWLAVVAAIIVIVWRRAAVRFAAVGS